MLMQMPILIQIMMPSRGRCTSWTPSWVRILTLWMLVCARLMTPSSRLPLDVDLDLLCKRIPPQPRLQLGCLNIKLWSVLASGGELLALSDSNKPLRVIIVSRSRRIRALEVPSNSCLQLMLLRARCTLKLLLFPRARHEVAPGPAAGLARPRTQTTPTWIAAS